MLRITKFTRSDLGFDSSWLRQKGFRPVKTSAATTAAYKVFSRTTSSETPFHSESDWI
jgi:hypothetical protein